MCINVCVYGLHVRVCVCFPAWLCPQVLCQELRTLKEKVEVLEEQKHLYERRLKTTKVRGGEVHSQ